MNFKERITNNKFSLVVSLPSNSLELAEAALEGGAMAVKVHCNVWHRASGHTFGSYAENREFLKKLIELCGDIPDGLVAGGEDHMGVGFAHAASLPFGSGDLRHSCCPLSRC